MVKTLRERLDVPEKIRDISEDRFTPRGRNIRKRWDERFKKIPIESPNPNIGPETAVGIILWQAIAAVNDYAPGDIGADTEISNVEYVPGGTKYTVDVNAGLESQSRAEAVIQASNGITGLWADKIDIQDVELLKKRPVRDTWRYTITVKD